MTTNEAYYLAIKKVKELKDSGIKVHVKRSKSRNDPEMVMKYSSPDHITPSKWIHVSFDCKNKEETNKVFEAGNYLNLCGISFDTGGWQRSRDWEFDWSFRYTRKEEIESMEERKQVENILDELID